MEGLHGTYYLLISHFPLEPSRRFCNDVSRLGSSFVRLQASSIRFNEVLDNIGELLRDGSHNDDEDEDVVTVDMSAGGTYPGIEPSAADRRGSARWHSLGFAEIERKKYGSWRAFGRTIGGCKHSNSRTGARVRVIHATH